MTDWIDAFANSLREDQKRKNVQYQHDLLRDRLIAERAPTFFAALAAAIRQHAEELNNKVGGVFNGVYCGPAQTERVTLTTGTGAVALTCRMNLRARQIKSETSVRGQYSVDTGGRHRDFHFNVATAGDGIWVTSEEAIFHSPTELASRLVKEAFTGEF